MPTLQVILSYLPIKMRKIKVLVVDDSALIRALLKEIINQSKDMVVIDTASDPLIARKKIRDLKPDVITLDIEMPNMNGLEFLEKLMLLHPIPVLMISTLTEKGSAATLRALELGAIDFIQKPKFDVKNKIEEYAEELVAKLRIVAQANVRPLKSIHSTKPLKIRPTKPVQNNTHQQAKLLVIGASTGGTEAIKHILVKMPVNSPPILMVQHMPEGFTKSFAARINELCQITVKEAVHNERILQGHAYLAPGDYHLTVLKKGVYYYCQLSQEGTVNFHRPSVDVLFNSVAKFIKNNGVGVILTGMGKDGALGLKNLHDLGCRTFSQDKASCVVFGMPKEAIELGAVDVIAPIDELAEHILLHLGYLQA